MHFVTKYRHWLLITIGSLVWSLTMVKSGLQYSYGLGFWGPNGHDGIWHLSLIESLARGRWEMPIFAGENIHNYHVGFDLLLAVIHRLTGISTSLLYFQITPPLLAIAIGVLSYKFVLDWTKSTKAALWSVFFVYFGGSLGWVLGKGESTFWSQQAISTLVNPPFALSLIMVLLGLIFLQKKNWLVAAMMFGLTFQIKVYAGVLLAAGLLTAAIWPRQKHLVLTWMVTCALGLVLLALTTTSVSSLIAWQPGWFLETMMGLSDRLNWPRFYSAMTNYRLSHNWFRAVPAYSVAFGVFIFGNLGTRILGLFAIKKFSWEEILMVTMIAGGIIVPMFFLQSGTPWNTIQFFYYSLFFSAILAGIAMSKIKSRLVIILIIALTLPTTWQTLKHYLPSRPPAKLAVEEIDALQFLSQQPRGVVLSYPYDAQLAKTAESNPPRSLYQYESTAYVSAFSGLPVYLEDEVNLNVTGYDWMSRRKAALDFFTTKNSQAARNFLAKYSIKYLYLHNVSQVRPVLSLTDLSMKNIYENSQTAIWARD